MRPLQGCWLDLTPSLKAGNSTGNFSPFPPECRTGVRTFYRDFVPWTGNRNNLLGLGSSKAIINGFVAIAIKKVADPRHDGSMQFEIASKHYIPLTVDSFESRSKPTCFSRVGTFYWASILLTFRRNETCLRRCSGDDLADWPSARSFLGKSLRTRRCPICTTLSMSAQEQLEFSLGNGGKLLFPSTLSFVFTSCFLAWAFLSLLSKAEMSKQHFFFGKFPSQETI